MMLAKSLGGLDIKLVDGQFSMLTCPDREI